MALNIEIPTGVGATPVLLSEASNALFVVGANGSGKSALLLALYQQHQPYARRVAAHRQTWFESGQLNLTSRSYQQTTQNIVHQDQQPAARYTDPYSANRPDLALFALLRKKIRRDSEGITRLEHDGAESAHQYLQDTPNPIDLINGLFRDTSLEVRIQISSQDADTLVARRTDSGQTYGIERLSDGERSALLLACEVLTAPKGSLLLLDEPERHMHRSIISPLLVGLFAKRNDCNFVISTHDLLLPHDCGPAPVLILRSCTFAGDNPASWDADLLEAEADIDDDLKVAVWGSRRTILYVEGDPSSCDKPLYESIFPAVTVQPAGSSDEVKAAVKKATAAESLHWLNVYGLIDRDSRTDIDHDTTRPERIYTLNRYAVESIYYNTKLQRAVGKPRARDQGEKIEAWLKQARNAALAKVRTMKPLPDPEDREALARHCDERDLDPIIAGFPIGKSEIPTTIATALGFRNKHEYERAVRVLLRRDEQLRTHAAAMCGDLQAALSTQRAQP